MSLLEKMLQIKNRHVEPRFKNLTLKKWLHIQDGYYLTSVGIFESGQYGKVIVKVLSYFYQNLIYEQLIHEMNVLKTLNLELSKVSKTVSVPQVYQILGGKKQVGFVSQFKEGKPLIHISFEKKKLVIKKNTGYFSIN